jgi:hypothetical protein
MKNFTLTVVVLALFIFIGCSQPTDTGNTDDSGDNTLLKTILTIKNESSCSLWRVKWQDTYFSSNTTDYSLSPGSSSTKEFSTSADLSGYIFLYKIIGNGNNNLSLRTQAFITVPIGEVFEFTLTDNSVVIDMENLNNIQNLASINRVLIPPYVTWTKFSNNTIIMRWDSVKYATGYTVYEKDPVSGSLTAIQRYVQAQGFLMEFTLNGIPSGKNLYFVVRASDDNYRYSEDSNVVTVYFNP